MMGNTCTNNENEGLLMGKSLHENISILVVDDHQGMLQTLTDILKDEDYQVTAADSGSMAIDLCQEKKFDVILMDVKMPELNGVETLRRIKDYITNTRVIMMSAYSVDELKRESLREGAVAFMQKPIDVEAVIKLIEQVEQPSILLASEDVQEMGVLVNYLNRHNYRAYVTEEISEVIDLVRQIHFSIIITDTNVISSDGVELHQLLKEITPRSFLIVLDETNKGHSGKVLAEQVESVYSKQDDTEKLLTILDEFKLQRKAGKDTK